MKWLNYHHLFYFWTVAKEGTITAACQRLHLAQPTVSAQLRTFEEMLGHKLFRQVGRRLELTETGNLVYRYANDIFALGEELSEALVGRSAGDFLKLRVGVADVLPKMVVSRVLDPVYRGELDVRMICFEGKPNELLARLSVHELDLVLSDSPIPPDVNLRAYNHQLGESAVSIFTTPKLAAKYRRGFPESLDQAPFLLPTANTSLRRLLDFWFEKNNVHPRILAEFEDSALLKMFAHQRDVLFPAPSAVEEQVTGLYGCRSIGQVPDVREQFFAISLERRVKHPAVVAIVEAAHKSLFS
jgi:LysR family transcriptional regulator, transcriptional activator of nhaA